MKKIITCFLTIVALLSGVVFSPNSVHAQIEETDLLEYNWWQCNAFSFNTTDVVFESVFDGLDTPITSTIVDDNGKTIRTSGFGNGFTANINSIALFLEHDVPIEQKPDDVVGIVNTSDQTVAYGDFPYQLHSDVDVYVMPGETYQLAFDVTNDTVSGEDGQKKEKNITLRVLSMDDEVCYLKNFRIPAQSTMPIEESIKIDDDYEYNQVKIEIAYGSYLYSFLAKQNGMAEEPNYMYAYGSDEGPVVTGLLKFDNFAFVGNQTDIDSISFTPAKEISVVEETGGTYKADADSKTYYEYKTPDIFVPGNKLIVTYISGSNDVFTCVYDEDNKEYVYEDASGERLDNNLLSVSSKQYEEHWGPDADNAFIITYEGRRTEGYVNVLPKKQEETTVKETTVIETTVIETTVKETTKAQDIEKRNLKKPKRCAIKKVSAKKKKAVVKWTKQIGADGYQVQCALNKKFTKKVKTKTIKKNIGSYTVKKIKSSKKYYFRVRAFVKDGLKRKFGQWSKVKSVKVK